jgi:hypothetical protein
VPIIYNYQPDEITAPPSSLTIDDDSLCWWAGTQQCFSSVALATILVASTFTSALAGNVHQHTEDVVAASAPLTVTDDDWQSNVIPQPAALFQRLPYLPDADSISFAAASSPLDDGGWGCGTLLNGLWPYSAGAIAAPIRYLQPFAFEPQDLPATASSQVDEDYWPLVVPAAMSFLSSPVQQLWSEIDFIFIPPAFQPDEDYWASAIAIQATRSLLLPIALDQVDFVGSPPGAIVEDGGWLIFGPPQYATANLQPLNAWLWTENSQEGITFLAPTNVVGLQWLRRDGHAKGLFSRRS